MTNEDARLSESGDADARAERLAGRVDPARHDLPAQPPPPRRGAGGARGRAERLADRLHSASIHLLRRLRRQDDASGVTAPHLSALSVLVFGGARTVGEPAQAEEGGAAALAG